MKILHLINSLHTGGAEKLIVDAVPLYQERGIEVDALLLMDDETPFRSELEKKSNGKVIGLSKGSVYNPLLIFKIIPYLKNYDVVHVHLFPALYWAVLAKWISFSKVKLVYTEHSSDNKRMTSKWLKFVDRFIYSRLTKIISISEAVDKKIQRHLLISSNRFQLIANGVNIQKINSFQGYQKNIFFKNDDFLLMQVSSFIYPKNQKTLIKAMTLLPENVKLLLVGDGILRQENEQLAQEIKVDHRVKFLGIRTDIPQLLKTADVVVLSSHYEGLSLSSVEGMATRPFVASDVPGLREVVDGYGLLFKDNDEKELASHILKLMNDPAFYKEIKEKCLQRAEDFKIEKMIDSYIGVYHEIIANK